MDFSRRPPSILIGALLTTAVSALALFPTWQAFARHPDSIHTTPFGDQSFYLWALERASRSSSFAAFSRNCDLSTSACFNLLSVPQEWPSFYMHGRLAQFYFGVHPNVLMSYMYYSSPWLNSLAAFAFVGVVTGRWLVAGAIGPLVGFQLGLVFRLRGHFSLVYLWPLIVALTLWWFVLARATRLERAPRKAILMASVAFGTNFALLSVLSYYYFAFSFPLLLLLTFSFFAFRRPESGFWRANRGTIAAALTTVAAGLATGVALNSHAMLGGRRALSRSIEDVWRYSPRIADYLLPYGVPGAAVGEGPFEAAPAFPLFRALGAFQSDASLIGRGEVFAFLGATVIALTVATLLECGRQFARDGRSERFRGYALFASLAAATLFLGTAEGGRCLHTFVPALRCFSRLAPIVVLFLGTFSALVWARHERAAPLLALAISIAGAFEFRAYAAEGRVLDPKNVWDLSDFRTSARAVHAACADGALRVEPPIEDYSLGPYWKLWASEWARCRLDGIGGPGLLPTESPTNIVGVLRNDWTISEE